MNDLKFSLGTMEAIYDEATRHDLTFTERAGLYAATRALCTDFERYIDEDRGGYWYAHQKVAQFRWHIGAALGF